MYDLQNTRRHSKRHLTWVYIMAIKVFTTYLVSMLSYRVFSIIRSMIPTDNEHFQMLLVEFPMQLTILKDSQNFQQQGGWMRNSKFNGAI